MSIIIQYIELGIRKRFPYTICISAGDMESMPFVEALRQLQLRVKPENFCVVHVSMVPTVALGEQKTKPTQHGIKGTMVCNSTCKSIL